MKFYDVTKIEPLSRLKIFGQLPNLLLRLCIAYLQNVGGTGINRWELGRCNVSPLGKRIIRVRAASVSPSGYLARVKKSIDSDNAAYYRVQAGTPVLLEGKLPLDVCA